VSVNLSREKKEGRKEGDEQAGVVFGILSRRAPWALIGRGGGKGKGERPPSFLR